MTHQAVNCKGYCREFFVTDWLYRAAGIVRLDVVVFQFITDPPSANLAVSGAQTVENIATMPQSRSINSACEDPALCSCQRQLKLQRISRAVCRWGSSRRMLKKEKRRCSP